MSRNDKRPRFNQVVETGKKPRVEADPDAYLDMYPVWRVGAMDWDGPWCWSKNNNEASLRDVWARLRNFETMKFKEFQGGKKKSHEIDVAACGKDAKDRLKHLGMGQVGSVYSLRISQQVRAFALRDRNVLRLLWWDPEHLVYPMDIADNTN